ncbi:Phosphoglucan phosphatase DSP4 chloroplastic [Zea mays]|uniref:Phosphoglucan phosphatase DSP4 chloroplastic n=1 Tax=Zea mays TaxID=4577 RepID=A0A1D6JKM0_MAIZE|nr:Phosphoglucan phosphatase DSP4 chloroplastic [Zea mays]
MIQLQPSRRTLKLHCWCLQDPTKSAVFQRIPLTYDEEKGAWFLEKELPEGRYEYKYVVDGKWLCNEHELITKPNADGHVNNYVQVSRDGTSDEEKELRERLTGPDPDLTDQERLMIREYLEQYADAAER